MSEQFQKSNNSSNQTFLACNGTSLNNMAEHKNLFNNSINDDLNDENNESGIIDDSIWLNDLKMTNDELSNLPSNIIHQSEDINNNLKAILAAEDDEIVISGISGRYPFSDNLEEFKNNLFSGKDMVNDNYDRWPKGIYGVPDRMGTIKDLSKFDAAFFNIHPKQAEVMDPQGRLLMEVAYEAIVDAGMSPIEVRGSRTSVINGCVFSESELILGTYAEDLNPYGITGCVTAMFANRVSFAFDFKSTSYCINTMCSSGLLALSQAVNAMRGGYCDSAIVSGTNLCIRPETTLCLFKHGMVSSDGTCRVFDADRSGYVRSEGTVAFFLQRKSVAKRNYATLVHVKSSNDGYKSAGFPTVNTEAQKKLISGALKEAGVKPSQIEYFEAHGTGTKVGDLHEANAIAECMSIGRNEPLLIGSVKSNCGHTEPASALVSITKLILTMESGTIPANLHYKTPNPEILALTDGRLKVVAKNTQYKGGLLAVNAFGVGGSNSHGILKRNEKEKKLSKYSYSIPRLVTVSGRTKEAIDTILDSLDPENIDTEFLALIDNIHKYNIPGHNIRGYRILTKTQIKEITEIPKECPPIWYIFTGTGSQWSKSAKDLMNFPIFNKSIRQCAVILEEYEYDLIDILTNASEESFNKVTNTFVSIVATQIALVDLLTSLGIKPDGFIGHSLGELGCAYADGALSAVQTIKAAYWRGQCLLESNLERGAMASIGLSWEEAHRTVPFDIQPACQNSNDNTTVSGPPDSIQRFVEKLQKDNIFAQVINSSDLAFHSKYVSAVGAKLLPVFQKIIPEPQSRSRKWVSSSIPESKWNAPSAKLASAEYFLNNLLSPVLFQSAISLIPENAVVIEVAPHRLFRAILKKALGKNVQYIGLLDKYSQDNGKFLLENIGRIYNSGLQPQVAKLYPEVEFPVSRGTPSFGSLVRWDHSFPWPFVKYSESIKSSGQDDLIVNLEKPNYKTISDHIIDGRIIFPAAGYLSLAWKIFAKKLGKNINVMPVVFEDVKFHRSTILTDKGVKFSINIMFSTGAFEISENGDVVSTGTIRYPQNIDTEYTNIPSNGEKMHSNDEDFVDCDDIYKSLRNSGYEYGDNFQGLVSSNIDGTLGEIKWDNNWISFLESMNHLSLFGNNTESFQLTTGIQKIVINPPSHLLFVNNQTEKQTITVQRNKALKVIRCGGVEVKGLELTLASNSKQKFKAPTLIGKSFVPHKNDIFDDTERGVRNALFSLLQDVLENSFTSDLNVAEIESPHSLLSVSILDILKSISESKFSITKYDINQNNKLVPKNKKYDQQTTTCQYHLVVGSNMINKDDVMTDITKMLISTGMILLEEAVDLVNYSVLNRLKLTVMSTQKVNQKVYILLKLNNQNISESIYLNLNDKKYTEFKDLLSQNSNKGNVYIFCGEENESDGINFVDRLKHEHNGHKIRLFSGHKSKSFDIKSYQNQTNTDLVMNIYKNGSWGSYKYCLLDAEHKETIMVRDAYIGIVKKQNKSSPIWVSCDGNSASRGAESETCRIYSSCVNITDASKTSNTHYQGNKLGMEFAGVLDSGRRVMGLVSNGALATRVECDNLLLWEVPKKWSLNEAATIPLSYVGAYYALLLRGKLQNGERVLIKNGGNSTGIAAVAVALSKNCIVYVTVNNTAEKSLLQKIFPQLVDESIVELSCVEQFLLTANNINLTVEIEESICLQQHYKYLASEGRVIQISFKNEKQMATLPMNAEYHTVNLNSIYSMSQEHKREISKLIKDAISQDAIKTLPFTKFSSLDIEDAFRNVKLNTINKTLLEINNENEKIHEIAAIIETQFKADRSYIILGEANEFGLAMADWMIKAGSKCIIFAYKGNNQSKNQPLQIRRWRRSGVAIHLLNVDKSKAMSYGDCELLVKEANNVAPIAGIFHVCLNSSELCYDNNCKTLENLHTVTKDTNLQLDHFVHFTSLMNQCTNEAWTKRTYPIKFLMQTRRNKGLPGLIIQWISAEDLRQRSIPSCIQIIDNVLNQHQHMVVSIQDSNDITKVNEISRLRTAMQAVASIIGITDIAKVSTTTTLVDLGMDSLMEPEIRSLLATKYLKKLNISEIRELTFDKLRDLDGNPRS